jgi:uncharacterized membrane protein YcfT
VIASDQGKSAGRVGWVDIAKGICILFVVMMHSTLGVGKAMDSEGFMHAIVAFAKPFRMPDFFLISGLFLAATINRPWRLYLDRKVLHFAYFYVLWLTIQFVFKAPGIAAEAGMAGAFNHYLLAFVQPFGTLWFIYMLPVFFIFTRLLSNLPKWWIFVGAAILNMAPIHTGSLLIDEFASRYVFFFTGYAAAQWIFSAADWVQMNRARALLVLALWATINGLLVFLPAPALLSPFGERISDLPLVGLSLGFAGAVAIVFSSALLAHFRGPAVSLLRHAGENSIVVYLAFFLPMAVTRTILIALVPSLGAGPISLIVTTAAFISPLILFWLINQTGYGHFLFRRPQWAIMAHRPIQTSRKPGISPAE